MNRNYRNRLLLFVFACLVIVVLPKKIFAQTSPYDVSFPPVLLLQQETSPYTQQGKDGYVHTWELPLNDAILQFLGQKYATSKSPQQTQITQIVQPAYTISDNVSITTTFSSQYKTNIVITNSATKNQTITFPDKSGEVSLLGQTISGDEIVDDTIDLLTKTTGNYLAGVVGGNGLSITNLGDQAASPSVSLGNLTSDWVQSGAYDIILNNKDSALKILDSDGTNYAVFDVGNLSSDITYTISGAAGTLLTSANYNSFLSGIGSGDMLAANNLSELTNLTTARSNLGLGTAAVQNVSAFLQVANNLSDLGDSSTARSSLGLGSIATQSISSFLQTANNLSDLNNATTARSSLGLGTIATQSAGNIFLSGGSLNAVTIPADLNTISGLTTSSFSTTNISQWTNNSGFITSSSSDTLTNKTLTTPVINGTVTTTGLTLPAFTASGTISGTGSPTITNFGAINGLMLTAASDGLTITGGTTPRTVTVSGADITIGNIIQPSATGALTIRSNGATVLTLDSGGNAGINIGTSNANMITLGASATVSANKTFSVASADSLLVGGNIVPQKVTIAVPMIASLLDQNVFVADATYQLEAVRCVYAVGALLSGSLQVTVDTGTSSPGTGTDQLTSTINLSTTVNTVYSGTVIGSPTIINAGDKVSVDVAGTLTGLLGTCTLTLKRV